MYSRLRREYLIQQVSIPITVAGGLQCQTFTGTHEESFIGVSIPITVAGGLQCYTQDVHPYERPCVSIPITVAGGLQYCAPEPLGLLAPDE